MATVNALTDTQMQQICEAWLQGRTGMAQGKRVLYLSYNGLGYLAVIQDTEIHRFHVVCGRIVESIECGRGSEPEINFAQACGRIIEKLIGDSVIEDHHDTPTCYIGIVMLYRLVSS